MLNFLSIHYETPPWEAILDFDWQFLGRIPSASFAGSIVCLLSPQGSNASETISPQ